MIETTLSRVLGVETGNGVPKVFITSAAFFEPLVDDLDGGSEGGGHGLISLG